MPSNVLKEGFEKLVVRLEAKFDLAVLKENHWTWADELEVVQVMAEEPLEAVMSFELLLQKSQEQPRRLDHWK